MENLDYEKDKRIDETGLDVEWLGQAELAIAYGKHVAELRTKVRNLEEKKKTVRSELILQVNNNSQGLIGKAKPNAGDIEAYYRTSQEYKDAITELNEMYEELEHAENAKNEISFTRKKALENLVILHGQMYFAGPSIPRDLHHEVMQKRKAEVSNSAVAGKMQRKK